MKINNIFIKLTSILIFILFSNLSFAEVFFIDEQGCPKEMFRYAKYSLNENSLNEKKFYERDPCKKSEKLKETHKLKINK